MVDDQWSETEEKVQETAESAARQASATVATLSDEFMSLGKHLALAVKAATRTPEAEAVMGDLREGVRTLRGELDAALSGTGVEGLKSKASVPPNVPLRAEVAQAIRSLNKALDRLAQSMDEPGAAEAAEEEVEVS